MLIAFLDRLKARSDRSGLLFDNYSTNWHTQNAA